MKQSNRSKIDLFAMIILGTVLELASAQEGPGALWERTYNLGAGGVADLTLLSDGNIAILGDFANGTYDLYALKLTPDGDSLWTQAYGDPQKEDYSENISPTLDGGFYVSGWQFVSDPGGSKCYIAKCNSDGGVIWENAFGDPGNQISHDTDQLDGIIVGADSNDVPYVARLTADGQFQWSRTYPFTEDGEILAIHPTSDGGIIACGRGRNPQDPDFKDVFLLKIQQSGELEFVQWYGWSARDWGKDVTEIPGDGYVIAAQTASISDDPWNLLLIKTDLAGDTLWTRVIEEGVFSLSFRVINAIGDGIIVSGMIRTDGSNGYSYLLRRYDLEGNHEWTNHYQGSTNWFFAAGLDTDSAGHYYSCVSLYGANPYVFKTEPDPILGIRGSGFALPSSYTIKAYPNPFNSSVSIPLELAKAQMVDIRIYNVLGQEVYNFGRRLMLPGRQELVWEGVTNAGVGLATGVYVVRARAGEDLASVKVELVR